MSKKKAKAEPTTEELLQQLRDSQGPGDTLVELAISAKGAVKAKMTTQSGTTEYKEESGKVVSMVNEDSQDPDFSGLGLTEEEMEIANLILEHAKLGMKIVKNHSLTVNTVVAKIGHVMDEFASKEMRDYIPQ